MAYLTGPRLILLGLAWFGLMEIWGGNIELLVALAIVLGFRWPAAWSFVLLTKITPGIGLLWFAVRREWRSLGIALAATAVVTAVSFALMPDAWWRWPQVLASNLGKNGTWAAVPIPFAVRLPFALVLVVWGALKNHRWAVPIAADAGSAGALVRRPLDRPRGASPRGRADVGRPPARRLRRPAGPGQLADHGCFQFSRRDRFLTLRLTPTRPVDRLTVRRPREEE